MGWISWIIIGLVAGALAKLIMPGRDPGGFIVTILIGIGGGLIGGFLGGKLGLGEVSGFNIATIATATAGAVVLLFLYRLAKK